jgi:hypothetical protein
MIKVIKFKKLKGGKKKYEITFEKNGKTYVRKFGAQGMSDFTIHKDRERRERYISRHKKDLRTNDPMKPGYLSMYILWNKPSVKASLADYKRRLGVYNRTGKFPKGITGSKKLAFGAIIPFEQTSMRVLPGDVQNLIQKDVSASVIQRGYKKYSESHLKLIKEMAKLCETPNKCKTPNELFWGLDPDLKEASNVYTRASNILTRHDLKTRFWYSFLLHLIEEFVQQDPNNDEGLDSEQIKNWKKSEKAAFKMLEKIDYGPVDPEDPDWYNDVYEDIKNKKSGFGTSSLIPRRGTLFDSVPDVVNKKLYASIKAKIKRSIKGRRWGAYDSGRLVREYKAKGGKYRGSKGKTDLGRWYKEKWVDACAWPKRKPCGRKTKEKIAYCRPSKKVDSKTPKLVQKLTKAQIKSRCNKKKRSPMKRVTKFGLNQEVTDKMRQQMFNQIMSHNEVITGIKNTIEKRCKRGFQDSFCQNIFSELLLSIYFTTVKNSNITDTRKKNITEMDEYIPKNFTATMLKIHRNQHIKVNELAYHLQDHTFGTFNNARIASLLYEYINVK